MKIKVSDIKPNPYRKMEHYPIDKAKVEALKTSIKDTSFWNNIIARKSGDKYEIAYGHHRWVAIKELGYKEIDIPIRPIEDYLMIKIMAEENLNWSTSPAVVNETVLATKEFLDSELAKCDDWATSDKSIKGLFDNQHSYETAKGMGIGRETILKFLGGNWKEWMIQEALKILKDEKDGIIDRKAVEMVGTVDKEVATHQALVEYKIPVEKQQKIVEKIIKNETPVKAVRLLVAQNSNDELKKNNTAFNQLENLVISIDEQSRSLTKKMKLLRKQMRLLKIEEIRGVKVWLTESSIKLLYEEIERLKGIYDETDK